MPRDLFGDVVAPSIKVGTQKWYTVPLSMLTHVAVIAALVIIPLLATDVLPSQQSVMAFAVPPPPPAPPPPPPPPPAAATPPPPQPVEVDVIPDAAPIEAPQEIKPEPPPVMRVPMVTGSVASSNTAYSGSQGVVGGLGPPPAAPPPVPTGPIRAGGEIKEPRKIHAPDPIYPKIAQAGRVSGTVILEAVISREGHVRDVKVVKSIPMLDNAAMEAVRQWRYTPTLLNNVPVEVLLNVAVTFRLN